MKLFAYIRSLFQAEPKPALPKFRAWEIQTTWRTAKGYEFTQCKVIWCTGKAYQVAVSQVPPVGCDWEFVSQTYVRHWGR